MSDPKPTPTPPPTNDNEEPDDPRDVRSDNEHPINTGHPNVARDGQYPPLEQTLGQETSQVAPLANAGVFTLPSGSKDNRNQSIVTVAIEAIKAIAAVGGSDDDEPEPAHTPVPVPGPTPVSQDDDDDDDRRSRSRRRSSSRSGSSPAPTRTPTPAPTPKPKSRRKVVKEDPGSFG